MSLTLNMVGGGGGGLKATDALLRVQAPANSTVTISKGTTTKTDLGHENADDHSVYDYYFIIHASQFDSVNAWRVTASLSGETAYGSIIIDSADEYDITLSVFIPDEYQAVEYLECTGTQYIVTTINAQYAEIETKVYVTEYATDAFLITSRSSSARVQFLDFYSGATRIMFEGNAVDNITYGQAVTLNTEVEIKAGAKQGRQYITVNGTTASKSYSGGTAPSGVFYMFYGYAGSTYYAHLRLYYLNVYNTSGTLIGQLMPCYRKADSVAGLYDIVNEAFLTNSGTGTFVVGGDL